MAPFLEGADGHERSECEPDRVKQGRVVGSTSDNRWLNLPPRLRPLRMLRGIFLMGAATPPFQGGEFAFPTGCPRTLCSAADLWVILRASRASRAAVG